MTLVQVQVHGTAEMRAVARRLREVPEKIKRESADEVRKVVNEKLDPAVRQMAVVRLPKRGGYATTMYRGLRFSTHVRFQPHAAGVSTTVFAPAVKSTRDINRIDAGILRHPVFGRRDQSWVSQRVRPGFVTQPFQQIQPDLVEGIDKALDRVRLHVEEPVP